MLRSCTPALPAALVMALVAAPPLRSAEEAIGSPATAGFRADYLMELARLRQRTLALAAEIPAPRYAARPAPGVHSLGECFAEMAAASRRTLIGMERMAPDAAGHPPPEKQRVVRDLAVVMDAVAVAVGETSDEGLEAPVDFLGRRWTVRALFLVLLGQMREGLGHVAAHAEDAGIVPPWLREKRVSEASDD